MAHARAASGASFTLHYYVSRAQEAAFATGIARQLAGGICQIHCSDEGQSPRQRRRGYRAPDADTRVYFCGPPGFMARVRDTARAVGWGEEQLHSEAFSRPPRRRRRRRTEPSPSPSPPPGRRWPVPGDKTIAQVLQEHGVAVPLSCEMGICGACPGGTRREPSTTGIPCSRRRKNRPQSSILRCAAPATCRPI